MAELGSFNIGSAKGLVFSLRVPGAQGFTVALSRFGSEIQDYTAFWEGRFKTWWYAIRKLDYAAAGGTTGPMWARLSDDYRRWKNQHFPSAPLLVLHGPMKASLVSDSAPGSIWRPRPTSLEVGSSISHAIYHQTGTRWMPARPPIRFAKVDQERLGKLLQAQVVEAWQRRRRAERGGDTAA